MTTHDLLITLGRLAAREDLTASRVPGTDALSHWMRNTHLQRAEQYRAAQLLCIKQSDGDSGVLCLAEGLR